MLSFKILKIILLCLRIICVVAGNEYQIYQLGEQLVYKVKWTHGQIITHARQSNVIRDIYFSRCRSLKVAAYFRVLTPLCDIFR